MDKPQPKTPLTHAGPLDPDRQLALRVTNFLGGMHIGRAASVYALAIQMSFRDLEEDDQDILLEAVKDACKAGWELMRADPRLWPGDCPHCSGIGTIGEELEEMQACSICGGTGGKP